MRWVKGASVLVALSYGLVSGAAQGSSSLRVFVYAEVGEDRIATAEMESSRIVERAGLRLIWRNCPDDNPCKMALNSGAIFLRIVNDAGKGGLGCSLVTRTGGVNAFISFGNIQKLAGSSHIPESQILAAVMAHELGHLLLGPAHSQTGLMHGNWDWRDLCRLEQRQLNFDSDQCRRIRTAVLARPLEQASLVATQAALVDSVQENLRRSGQREPRFFHIGSEVRIQ